MSNTKFKIGDYVNIVVDKDIASTGELLGQAIDHPLLKGWIVLLLDRKSDFLKERPEKAIIVYENQMAIIPINERSD